MLFFLGALIPVGAYIALQYPSLQTVIAKEATKILSKRLHTEVSIGKVYYQFFNKLILSDVYILSENRDTLLKCGKVSLSFSARDLISKKYHFNKARLSDGVFNYIVKEDGSSNVSRILKYLKRKAPADTSALPVDLLAQNFRLDNFRFNYKNLRTYNQAKAENVVNFSDLRLSNINLDVKNVKFVHNTLLAEIKKLAFKEKSGFETKDLNAKVKIKAGDIRLSDLYIYDGYSEVKAKHFNMKYPKYGFRDFVNKVIMEIDMDNTYFDLRSLWKIAPALVGNSLSMYASGLVSGPVSNLYSKDLKVTSESGLTTLDLDVKISGLPKADEAMAFVDINNCFTTTPDLARVISSLNSTRPLKTIYEFSPLVKYNFKGRMAGLLTDFVVNGNLTSNIGNVYMDMLLKQDKKQRGMYLQGKLRTEDFNIGMLMNKKMLGQISFSSTMSALLRNEEAGGSNFYIDSISIKKFDFKGYQFKNIYSVGSYVDNVFNGRIICHDPNLDFIFQGIFAHSKKRDSYYDFYADVAYADLSALGLDKRDSVSEISFKTMANFTKSKKGDILGSINVKNMDFRNSSGEFPIGDVSIKSSSSQNDFNITLNSSFANATYKGNDFFTNFIDKILSTTAGRHAPALLNPLLQTASTDKPKYYKFNVNFLDTRAVNEFLLPGLFIANKSTLKISIDENNLFDMELKANRIGFKQNLSDNLLLKVRSNDINISTTINSSKLQVAGIEIDSSRINIDTRQNKLSLLAKFGSNIPTKNHLTFSSDVLVSREEGNKSPHFEISINPSELLVNKQKWVCTKSNIDIRGNTLCINKFKMLSKDQELNIDGTISENSSDSLKLRVNNLDINPLNLIINKKYPFNFHGYFSGIATLTNAYNDPGLILNLLGRDVSAYGEDVGDLNITSDWNKGNRLFDITVRNNLNGAASMDITGTYKPDGNIVDFYGKMDNLKATYFEPFLKDIVSRSGGGISGDFHLTGPLKRMALNSTNATLNNLTFNVNYTKVQYTLNGPALVTEKGVRLNNVTIKDRFGNTGRVNGGFLYDHFWNMVFNTVVNFNNLECLNTKDGDNPSFYGGAFGSGTFKISGPLPKISMDITATSNKNTEIHIPLPSTSEAVSSNLLTFKEPPVEESNPRFNSEGNNIAPNEKKKGTELDVKLKLNVTPDAAMLIEVDKSVGDIITGYGSGLVTMDINPSKDIFSILGDYQIDRGYYKFVLQGLFNRDFTIQQGGNIVFNGSIDRTNINLTANYRTKASINALIADTSSVGSRRNVDCLIKMSGSLMNPTLNFGIDIPDIDPLTKARVDAALSTDDKVIRQVMSILVSGSFIPDVQSSIVNNSAILYSNATEVLSNQINNIFNQLDIPLDLSFNYQPGQNGRDIFDAAVSAQLFNNRVIVNGNIGSSKYMNKSDNVVGDLDVEVKLDEKGRLRAKAFSHSADQFSNYLDNSQRNGVGLVYQEEFRSFRELFNSIFMSQKRRAKKAAERERQLKGQLQMKPLEDKMKITPEQPVKP